MGAGEVSIVWYALTCVLCALCNGAVEKDVRVYVSPPLAVSLQDVMDEDQPQVCMGVCVCVCVCVCGRGRGIICPYMQMW